MVDLIVCVEETVGVVRRLQKNERILGNHLGHVATRCSYRFKAIMPDTPELLPPLTIIWTFINS
jgi:hypothetical protein